MPILKDHPRRGDHQSLSDFPPLNTRQLPATIGEDQIRGMISFSQGEIPEGMIIGDDLMAMNSH